METTTATFTPEQFQAALDGYVAKLTERSAAHYAAHYTNLTAPTFEVHPGKRYMKIVTCSEGQGRSVHTFVDRTNGNVLKAAGWAAPAKHARGSIFSDKNGMEACSVYGGNYLR